MILVKKNHICHPGSYKFALKTSPIGLVTATFRRETIVYVTPKDGESFAPAPLLFTAVTNHCVTLYPLPSLS